MPPESCGKRGIKIDRKRIALFEVILLSRDKRIYIPNKTHIYMFHYDTTCDRKHQLKEANGFRYILKV